MKSKRVSRIGFDGRWYNRSGVGNYMLGLLNALVSQQGRYRLVLFEHPSNPVPTESAVERIALLNGRYSPLGQFEFTRQLTKQGIDLVHCPFYVAPFATKCPVVITIYDVIPFRFSIYGAVKQAIVKAGYKAGVRKAAGILVSSHQTASDCVEILGANPARTKVAYAGCAPEFRADSEPNELEYLARRYGVRPPYVLLLGSKHWRTKGFGWGMKALARCKSEHDFQIVWVGAEEALTEDPEVSASGLSGVLKTGFVPNSDLARLYRHAHAFVLPSLYEGFGMPLLEAMSCGCPVVCSDGGSLPEVAGSGAVVVPHDIDRMVAAINAFLRDDDLRTEQKKRAVERAREFSWTRSAKVALGLYEQILGLSSGALSPAGVVQESRGNSENMLQSLTAIEE